MAFTFEIADKKEIVKFYGDLTVGHAVETRKVLMRALKVADQVLIDFGNVTDADISSLQALCSAHKTAARLGKRLSYDGTLPEALRKAAEEAGYERSAGCCPDCLKNCFWAPE
jgi:anti-anti-sigma regulatory factor